jgi:hypothetical protein
MSDCCEYAELRRRAEDAEFDLVTMTRARDRLLKRLDDLRAESRSTEMILKGEAEWLRTAMRQALEEIDKKRWNWVSGALLRGLGDLPPLDAKKEQ